MLLVFYEDFLHLMSPKPQVDVSRFTYENIYENMSKYLYGK